MQNQTHALNRVESRLGPRYEPLYENLTWYIMDRDLNTKLTGFRAWRDRQVEYVKTFKSEKAAMNAANKLNAPT